MRYLEIGLEQALQVTVSVTAAPVTANAMLEESFEEDMAKEDQ